MHCSFLLYLLLKNKNYNRKHSILITFKMMKEFYSLLCFTFWVFIKLR